MEMNDAQKRAWDYLTDKERQALFLQISEGKSTWECSLILDISHYKYLELRDRSEHLFKLFSDFFEKYPAIFRPDCPCQDKFKDYIEGLIEFRLTKGEARKRMGEASNIVPTVNNRVISRNMQYLKESGNKWDIETLLLIHAFDCWNNFRILPGMLQQPSPYKRRRNKKDKIYLEYILRLPAKLLEKLKKKHWYKIKAKHKPRYYIALLSNEYKYKYYKVIPVRTDQTTVDELTKYYLYIFENEEDADTFGFYASKYYIRTESIIGGQKYWPEYRRIVERAINFDIINNLTFSIKSLAEVYRVPYNKMPQNVKKTPKNQRMGLRRANPELFYDSSAHKSKDLMS